VEKQQYLSSSGGGTYIHLGGAAWGGANNSDAQRFCYICSTVAAAAVGDNYFDILGLKRGGDDWGNCSCFV
jgi:hypothetical protein